MSLSGAGAEISSQGSARQLSLRPLWEKLSPPQQYLMELSESSLGFSEIGDALCISEKAVKMRMKRIYDVIGADNRLHAVVMLMEERHRAEIQAMTEAQAYFLELLKTKATPYATEMQIPVEDVMEMLARPLGAEKLVRMWREDQKDTTPPAGSAGA